METTAERGAGKKETTSSVYLVDLAKPSKTKVDQTPPPRPPRPPPPTPPHPTTNPQQNPTVIRTFVYNLPPQISSYASLTSIKTP